jgi:hypothetical protein
MYRWLKYSLEGVLDVNRQLIQYSDRQIAVPVKFEFPAAL